MPENDTPVKVAEKFVAALRAHDLMALHDELAEQVPSIVYPRRKGKELIEKFADFGTEHGRKLEKEWKVTTEAEGWLYSYVVQDDVAVHCGMPEDQRVTCAEHRAWRTAEHLEKHHTGAGDSEPGGPAAGPAVKPDPAFRVQVLNGHVSPETAYVVDDYPYGRELRCTMRHWIETATKGAKQGQQRSVYQTTNPKKAGEPWNKPHPGTYSMVQALYLDGNGHVQNWGAGLHLSPASDARTQLMDIPAQLTEENRRRYDLLVKSSKRYAEPWEQFETAVSALADYIREHGGEPETPNGMFESAAGRWHLSAPDVYLAVARQRVDK